MAWLPIINWITGGEGAKEKIKNQTELFMETITEANIRAIQTCRTEHYAIQLVSVKGNGNKLTGIDIATAVDFRGVCRQNASSISQVHDSMNNDLKQKAAVSEDSFGKLVRDLNPFGRGSDTLNELKVSQRIKDIFTFETVNESITKLQSQQVVEIVGHDNEIAKLTLSYSAKIVTDMVQNTTAYRELKADVANKMQQDIEKKENSTLSWLVISGLVIAFLVVAGPYILPSGRGGGGGGNPGSTTILYGGNAGPPPSPPTFSSSSSRPPPP